MKKNSKQGTYYSVVLFYSISSALHAEKLCKGKNVPVKLIPVPRHLSSDCGICLCFARQNDPEVRRILNEGKVEIEGIHQYEA